MKKTLLLLALLSPVALAQTAPGGAPGAAPGGQGGPTAAQRAQFAKFQPIFDLQRSVGLIGEVDKVQGLAFSRDQAKKLLPILKDLQTRGDLKPADATKILNTLENTVYTTKQLAKMDDIQLAREEERRKRMQQAGAQGGQGGQGFRLPGVPGPGIGGGQGGQGGPRAGGFADMLAGKPFNPFKGERQAKMLSDTLAMLAKK